MNRKRIFALAFAVLMVLSLAACGTRDNDKMANGSGNGSAMTGEPKTAEEALALHKELLERENALLSENTELWEKVFMEADKGMAMIEDGKNYGDFLLDTVEAAKEQFTDKEYEWLKESATEISNIENKLTALEEKYPEIVQQSMDGDMSTDIFCICSRNEFAKYNDIISSVPIIMNRDAVVYAHVGLFKQDVQLAVQNQIGISKRVIVDQIIQL